MQRTITDNNNKNNNNNNCIRWHPLIGAVGTFFFFFQRDVDIMVTLSLGQANPNKPELVRIFRPVGWAHALF